jgi:hypothetical protein
VNITGTAIMHAPAGQVWAALTDPAVLARTIPGCERLEPAGPDSYRFTVTAGVASVRGTYTGEVALSQQREPTSLVLTARCAGGPGTVATSIHITLTPAGATTQIGYDADAAVSGLIASVGQRMLASVAGRLGAEFFTSVDQVLTGNADQVLTGNGAAPAEPAPLAVPGPTEVPAMGPTTGGTAAPAFLGGALVGAAATAAGVAIARLIGRRAR